MIAVVTSGRLPRATSRIVFTSGGTESDNFGVKGLAWARGRGHLITSKVEHHAVLRTCQALEAQGFSVSYLPVDETGMIDPDDVRRALRPDTIAISIMHANSEVGTIQPVRAIGAIARERGIPFHVDAVQTFGKVEIDVDADVRRVTGLIVATSPDARVRFTAKQYVLACGGIENPRLLPDGVEPRQNP